nr:hypothetical protein [Tanacetum cinerariifolium]
MDLFAFIHHADPTKVKIGERERERERDQGRRGVGSGDVGANKRDGVAATMKHVEQSGHVVPTKVKIGEREREIETREGEEKTVDDAGGSSLPPKKLRGDHDTSEDAGATTAVKSLIALQDLLDKSRLAAEIGVTAAATIPPVPSSVAPIPEHEGNEYADSVFVANVWTRRPSERFVISSDTHDSNANAIDDEVSSIARSAVSRSTLLIPIVLTTAVATTIVVGASIPQPRDFNEGTHASIFADSTFAALHQAYVPKWDIPNGSLLDDSDICRNVVDQLAHPLFFLQLRAMDYDQLLGEFNVRAARQTCLSAEVRMRLEHLLWGKKRLEGSRTTKAIRLRGQIANVEVAGAIRVGEFKSLKGRNAALESVATDKDAEIARLTQDLSVAT